MTKFKDIATAYEAYERSQSWGQVNYGLIYTCNAGWIDLGHMGSPNARRNIGASNLWLQLSLEGPDVRREACMIENADLNIGYTALKQWVHGCNSDPYFRFPDGSTGYAVTYRQDHESIPGRPGAGGHYVVRKGLMDAQKKSVALSIYMDVSHRFENFQQLWGLGDWFTDSGYSQDDLVSNLLGFYIAVGEMTKTEAIRISHPVSRATAESIWNEYGAVGENKNEKFEPVLRDTGIVDDAEKMCRDDCMGQPRKFPVEFQTIKPVEPGTMYAPIASDGLFSPF